MRSRARRTLAIALAGLMLLWSAAVNGRPSVFADLALYYAQAEYLASALGWVRTPALPPGDPTALPAQRGAANVSATIDRARSPLYGLFVYGLERIGGLWLAAGAQAFLVALQLELLFRTVSPRAGGALYLAWMAALCGVTSLAFVTSFIMPDVFTGVAAAGTVLALIYWDRVTPAGRAATFALLVFSICAHRSNLLIVVAAMLCGAGLLAGLRVRPSLIARRCAVLAAAVLTASLLGAVAFLPIERRAGEAIHDPPFLMARVLADGPGRRYLALACKSRPVLALCDHRDLPPEDSDTLLWSNNPEDGLFGVSDYATRLRLEAEEPAFVLHAVANDPLGEIEAAAENTGRQLLLIDVRTPLADPTPLVIDGYWNRTSLPRIIPSASQCRRPGGCASRLALASAETIQDLALALSILAGAGLTVWIVLRRDWTTTASERHVDALGEQARVACMLVLVIGLILANACVCGALSAPVARYGARLIWMLPAVVMLGGLAFGADRRQASPFADKQKIF